MLRSAVCVLLALSCACAARHGGRTVGAGNTELALSVGGPVFQNLGAPIPLPLAHIGARHGVRERIDVTGGVHLTAAAFGVVGADAGARVQLWHRPGGPAVLASALANVLVGTREGVVRVFPELGVHGELPVSPRHRLLAGVDTLIQHAPPDGKPPVLAAPYLGWAWRRGGHGVSASVAWISPWTDSTSVVDYAPGAGAFALQLGYQRGAR